MNTRSYLEVAEADLEYLKFSYAYLDRMPNYNAVVVQEQQVVEKLLKHVVNCYSDSSNVATILNTHTNL